MRKLITNAFATSCMALILHMALVSIMYGKDSEAISFLVFYLQMLGVNIFVHIGLSFTRKFECKYAIFEYLLDICFISIVVVVFGLIFCWFAELWLFVIMVVVIYIVGLLVGMVRTREEANQINRLLKKRKEKNADAAS